MNWYKTTQLKETLSYFQEFEKEEYIPEEESVNAVLENQFGASIISEVGRGDSGIAYLLSNGDVLKITTNSQEGAIARYVSENPIPCIVDYKLVWQEGDLYYIVMEKIDQMGVDNSFIKQEFKTLEAIVDKNNIYDPAFLYQVIKNNYDMNFDFKRMILPYLFYLQQLPFKIFDFININNVGLKDGKLIFFDVT
jgi:hypothetical protein